LAKKKEYRNLPEILKGTDGEKPLKMEKKNHQREKTKSGKTFLKGGNRTEESSKNKA